MKLRKSLLLMLMALIGVTACSVDDVDDNRVPIEPEDLPMFQFDDNGVPYYYGAPNLPKEMQRDLQKEFVGYGWKWMQTNEIMADGRPKPNDFYADMYGMTPCSYYVESEANMTVFLYAETMHDYVSSRGVYQMDVKTGMVTCPAVSSYGLPEALYMRVWSIYKLSDRWYMSCVQPLAMRTTEDGNSHLVWGTSQYVRMTDDELAQMKEKYNYEPEK